MAFKIIIEYHKKFLSIIFLNVVETFFLFLTQGQAVYLVPTEGRVGSVRQSALVVDVIHNTRWQHWVVVVSIPVLGGLVLQTVPPASTVRKTNTVYSTIKYRVSICVLDIIMFVSK